MKKYSLFLFILSFILLGFLGLNNKTASATNCAPGDLFSTVTGQSCGTTIPTACKAGDLFSSLTGQPCSGTPPISYCAAQTNFQINDKGDDVKTLQTQLNTQGASLKVDGSYGPLTQAARLKYCPLPSALSITTDSLSSGTVIISEKIISPQDSSSYWRPEIVAIGNRLFFAYNKKNPARNSFGLIEMDENLNSKNSPVELYSGDSSYNPMDIRLASDGTNLFYAYELVKNSIENCGDHSLNIVKYDPSNLTNKIYQNNIARGCGTTPEIYQKLKTNPPTDAEAVDDPTPFYFNNQYYVLTRAWHGQKQHVRVFDNNLKKTDDFVLDLTSALGDKEISQNALVNINGSPYLIAGIALNILDSDIYAIPLDKTLKKTSGDKIPLLIDPSEKDTKITSAIYSNGYLYINYAKAENKESFQNFAVFKVQNNQFTKEYSQQVQQKTFEYNHASLAIFKNKLYTIYSGTSSTGKDVILANVYELSSNNPTPVNSVPPTTGTLSITTTSLLDGTIGIPYSATLTATGGTGSYVWSASLPPWLSINSTTGVISGIPNSSGILVSKMGYTLGITLTSGEQTVFKYINLFILWSPNGILTMEGGPGPGQSAIVGDPETSSFGWSGIGGGSDQYVWSISGLPPELSLFKDTCSYSCDSWRAQTHIIGTPTTVGTFPITVTLTCGTQTISKQFILRIVASVNAPTAKLSQSVTTTPSTQGFTLTWDSTNATSCSMSKTVNGGASGPVAVYAADMAWYSDVTHLNGSTAALSGGSAIVGTHVFTFSCTGPGGSDSQSVTHYVVSSTNAPSITTTSLPNGTVGTSYSASLDGRGDTWSASGLPAGLNLSGIVSNSTCSGPTPTSPVRPCPTSTGITGNPTTAGTYTVTVTLISGQQTVSKQFSLVVGRVLGVESFKFTQFLTEGSRGNEVMELQKFLNVVGYDTGNIDGIFGPKVKAALIKFQIANNLKSDGIVGFEVRTLLNK